MNELTNFLFGEGQRVRTLERDGEPWVVLKDVCDILGHSNPTKALQMLDDDEKDVVTRASDPNLFLGSGGPGQEGGAQSLNIINESGLYNLIFRSNKPEARAFRKWITSVVLPSIRQKGYYAKSKQLMDRLEAVEKELAAHKEGLEKFKGYAVEAHKKLAVRQDEVEARVDGAYKEVLDSATSYATGEVIEYLLSSHKPSAHEAQLADLKRWLSLNITPTGDRRDKIDLFRLYPGYDAKVRNPMPKDTFASFIPILYPQIKFKSGVFSGVRFDY